MLREGIALDNSASFFARNQFLIRRLHSLSGLIPVGAYMVVHLLTNASIWGGGPAFQANVDRIHSLGPFLPFVEWTFIFIPLIFHTVIGFVIIGGAIPNSTEYPYVKNIRYTLQRATGIIAFAFILWHVLQMHYLGEPLKRLDPHLFAQFDPHDAAATASAAIQYSLVIQLIYVVGVLACVYHLANGLWTMGITWGVWTSVKAQRRADLVCSAFGVGLTILGLAALFGFIRFSHAPIIDLAGGGHGKHKIEVAVASPSSPTPLAKPDATLSDLDSDTLDELVVKIMNPWDGAAEVLAADVADTNIKAQREGEVLTLRGRDSLANYQKVLHSVTYQNNAPTPNPADRQIAFRASDGRHRSNIAFAVLTARPTKTPPGPIAEAASEK